MNILGLSGSLRAASVNSMLLRAFARIAPKDINVTIFTGLGELPLFNPDLEAQLPETVVAFHRAVADADAVLVASPEYAHGVTGTIKNALDWIPLLGTGLDESAMVATPFIATAIRDALRVMRDAAPLNEGASNANFQLGSAITCPNGWRLQKTAAGQIGTVPATR